MFWAVGLTADRPPHRAALQHSQRFVDERRRIGAATTHQAQPGEQNKAGSFQQVVFKSCSRIQVSSQLRDLRLRATKRDDVGINVHGFEVRQEVFQLKNKIRFLYQ